MRRWLAELGYGGCRLTRASEDASFRRYLRLERPGGDGPQSLIVMDAPPDLEPCEPFVRIGARLREAGLSTPRVHAADLDAGFLLLEDFGDDLYLEALAREGDAGLYADALDALLTIQTRLDAVSVTVISAEGL